MGKPFKDLTGQQFGLLEVIEISPCKKEGRSWFICKCKCGNITPPIRGTTLIQKLVSSCGCITSELISKSKIKHGICKRIGKSRTYTTEYNTWLAIKNRCLNNKCIQFKDYGGRGIKICDRWLNSFENFLEDMGHKPSMNYSIDRKENNKDYCKENCRWATRIEQQNNKSNNNHLTINNETHTIAEWAKIKNIKYSKLLYRVKMNMPIDKLFYEGNIPH